MSDAYDYEYSIKKRPHVVILGAGASCAAIPNGDKNGRKISAMNGFIKKLNLDQVISDVDIQTTSDNLEEIYMELDERSTREPECNTVKNKLESEIHQYFSEYVIPDEPTVYDMLILSLTKKDLIATFNWDPLLVQAYLRSSKLTRNLPQLAFLHGNVMVGYCEIDNMVGRVGQSCPCGNTLQPVKLLYPIKEKKYDSEIAIDKFWKSFSSALEVAYMVTIFGYSAPKSDVAAIEMMKKAWGEIEYRDLEEIEIIDIRKEDEVLTSWQNFVHTHHYSYHNQFVNSSLGRFPRRSCEATFDRLMNVRWLHADRGYEKRMSFTEINDLLFQLIEDEQIKEKTGELLLNPYL